MDQDTQQTTSETPPTAAPGQGAPSMPPMTNYPMSSGGGMVSQDDKSQAMLMWILTIFFWFVPSLIFFLTAKDKPYTYRQSALALTWCIAAFALGIAIFILSIIFALVTAGIGGLFMLVIYAIPLANLIICIMGAVATSKGEDYNPPVVTGFAKSLFKV
jgi:uncharacterized membrane protein